MNVYKKSSKGRRGTYMLVFGILTGRDFKESIFIFIKKNDKIF